MKWVPPTDIAAWQLLLTVETILMFLRFGVVNAFNREFSFLLGKQDSNKAMEYLNTVEFYILVLCGLSFILISLGYFFNLNYWGINSWAILAFSLYFPAKFYSAFYELMFRSKKDFNLLSKLQIWTIILSFLTLPLVIWFEFSGFLMRMVLISFVGLLFSRYLRPYPFFADFKYNHFKYLFKSGIPLFFSNYTQSLVATIPILLLTFQKDIISVGFFYPVNLVLNYGTLMSSSVSLFLLPKLNFEYGRLNDRNIILSNSIKESWSTFWISLPFVFFGILILPTVIKTMIPNYVESIVGMQLALLLTSLSSFNLLYNPFTVFQEWRLMYIYLGAAISLSILVPFTAIFFFPHISKIIVLILSIMGTKIILIGLNYFLLKFMKN